MESGIVIQTIRKISEGSKNTAKTTGECESDDNLNQKNIPTLFLQYTNNEALYLKESCNRQRIFSHKYCAHHSSLISVKEIGAL